jgi:hypothetical protein
MQRVFSYMKYINVPTTLTQLATEEPNISQLIDLDFFLTLFISAQNIRCSGIKAQGIRLHRPEYELINYIDTTVKCVI